jgi:hypothetical protein
MGSAGENLDEHGKNGPFMSEVITTDTYTYGTSGTSFADFADFSHKHRPTQN